MTYIVKLSIRNTVETGKVFLEKSIPMPDAESFDDTYLKAENMLTSW